MEIHARTTKWSKGVKEMEVLSLQEKEIVCNKVAKQLFIICTTISTFNFNCYYLWYVRIARAFRVHDSYRRFS